MNKIFNLLVKVEGTRKLESLLNTFRIGLNDWDKSKVFELQGRKVVNYTILTDEETFKCLKQEMKRKY